MDTPWCTQQISFFLSRSVEPAISNSSTKEHQSNWGSASLQAHMDNLQVHQRNTYSLRSIFHWICQFTQAYDNSHVLVYHGPSLNQIWGVAPSTVNTVYYFPTMKGFCSNHERFLQCWTGLGKNCPKELFGNKYLRFQKNRRCSSAHSVAKGNLKICWQALVTLVYMGNTPSQP